jgi:hypothetical protein
MNRSLGNSRAVIIRFLGVVGIIAAIHSVDRSFQGEFFSLLTIKRKVLGNPGSFKKFLCEFIQEKF